MPQQLIYTSSPRLITAGRSGFGTVARSSTMRDALVLRLEQLSYFEHRAMAGGLDRVVCACRFLEVRGARYHIISRLQDAGLDFTKRTNFIAHHLVFTEEEIASLPLAPDILAEWNGWVTSWAEEPRLLANEAWGNLHDLGKYPHAPAKTWARLAGDGANALGFLDAKTGMLVNADNHDHATLLNLISESLALMEVSDLASDFRSSAWRFTFTTSLQEQDDGGDFKLRFIHSDSPAFSRLSSSGQNPLTLTQVRHRSPSAEAVTLARQGYQSPRFTREPEDLRIQEGGSAVLRVEVEGAPLPRQFHWFLCSRDGTKQPVPNQHSSELKLEHLPQGLRRYCVTATTARGDSITSRIVLVSVDPRPVTPTFNRAPRTIVTEPISKPNPVKPTAWAADAEETAKFMETVRKNKRRKKVWTTTVSIFAVLGAAGFFVFLFGQNFLSAPKKNAPDGQTSKAANAENQPPVSTPNAPIFTNAIATSEITETNNVAVSEAPPPQPKPIYASGNPPAPKTNFPSTNAPVKKP